ncbi:MAG: hypothetical protein M1511_17255 [Deltaproteobacteria bacterium]|nr:hypothetical protein [Deltaproteobacteria bacterium]
MPVLISTLLIVAGLVSAVFVLFRKNSRLKGNFSSYLFELDKVNAQLKTENKKLREEIKRLKDSQNKIKPPVTL